MSITVDHDAAEIRNAAILEVGLRLDDHEPPTAATAESYLEAANYMPPPAHESTVAAFVQELTELSATHPDHVDAFRSQFFGGGNREHIDGLHAPLVRLGHPRGQDILRLDLANTAGVVVGVIRNAWLDGPQLRGDIAFLEDPPIPDWTDVLAAILAMAAERPADALGLSICPLPCSNGDILPVAVDLVSRPACNRHGLLGLPSNGAAAHPRSPVREVGRRRAYRSDLGQQVGQLVYESLLEAWIAGREPA